MDGKGMPEGFNSPQHPLGATCGAAPTSRNLSVCVRPAERRGGGRAMEVVRPRGRRVGTGRGPGREKEKGE
jgi:hypothetical protein